MNFQSKLKQCRIINGYTLKEMATLIDVSPATYSHYEKGKSQPNVDVLKRIVKVLDIDANYLLKDKYTEIAYVIEK